jgi:hypothetical protein
MQARAAPLRPCLVPSTVPPGAGCRDCRLAARRYGPWMPADLLRLPVRDGSHALHVVVETPGGCRVKLKYSPTLGTFLVSRPLPLGRRRLLPAARRPADGAECQGRWPRAERPSRRRTGHHAAAHHPARGPRPAGARGLLMAATWCEGKDLRLLGWGDAAAADALVRDAGVTSQVATRRRAMALDGPGIRRRLRKLRKLPNKAAHRPAPERVHDLRTHARWFEATLEALGLDGGRNARRVRAILETLRRRAGKVRDMDVLTGYAASVAANGEEECLVELLEYWARNATGRPAGSGACRLHPARHPRGIHHRASRSSTASNGSARTVSSPAACSPPPTAPPRGDTPRGSRAAARRTRGGHQPPGTPGSPE